MLISHFNSSEWESVGGTITSSNGTGSATSADGRVTSVNPCDDFSLTVLSLFFLLLLLMVNGYNAYLFLVINLDLLD